MDEDFIREVVNYFRAQIIKLSYLICLNYFYKQNTQWLEKEVGSSGLRLW